MLSNWKGGKFVVWEWDIAVWTFLFWCSISIHTDKAVTVSDVNSNQTSGPENVIENTEGPSHATDENSDNDIHDVTTESTEYDEGDDITRKMNVSDSVSEANENSDNDIHDVTTESTDYDEGDDITRKISHVSDSVSEADENSDNDIHDVTTESTDYVEGDDITWKMSHVSDSVSEADERTQFLSALSNLCPGAEVCDWTGSSRTNSTKDTNECCIGCSCEASCVEYQNCCYDNVEVEGRSSMSECLMPLEGTYSIETYDFLTTYRFVVTPPPSGCVTIPSYSENDIVSWGDFYPVYSRSLDLNFKNEYIARCHGAKDIQKWEVVVAFDGVEYEGAQALTSFYKTLQLNSTQVFLIFEPPSTDATRPVHVCYYVIDTCPDDIKDTFYIPPTTGLDRQAIVEACDKGPGLLYFKTPSQAFRNVFCAICNAFTTLNKYDVRCRYYISDTKNQFLTFRSLLIGDAIKTDGSGQQADCYMHSQDSNGSECTDLQCPLLQIPSSDGTCTFPGPQMRVECLTITLNLTTTQHINKSTLVVMSPKRLISIFTDSSPWQRHWDIIRIALRLETNRTEFHVFQKYRREEIDLRLFIPYVYNRIRKPWTVVVDKELHFEQNFALHGANDYFDYSDDDNLVFQPEWYTLNTFDISTVERPSWEIRFEERLVFRQKCMLINKLFFCRQIELRYGEFQVQSQKSLLYLNRSNSILYPDEFSLFFDESGNQIVSVCLGDSGYAKVVSMVMSVYVHTEVMIVMGGITAFMFIARSIIQNGTI